MSHCQGRKCRFKLVAAVAAVSAAAVLGGTAGRAAAQAVILYDTSGSTYTQNFDSLPYTPGLGVNAATPATLGAGAGTVYTLASTGTYSFADPINSTGSGAGNAGTGTAAGLGLSDPTTGMVGWYAQAGSNRLGANAGGPTMTTGSLISYGPTADTGFVGPQSDRALGMIDSPAIITDEFAIQIENNTSSTLDAISLSYIGELWQQSATAKTVAFNYIVTSPGYTVPAIGTGTNLVAGNISFATNAGDPNGVGVDGTSTANQANISISNQYIGSWAPGQSLWLFWTENNNASKGQGIAIDNFNFSASAAAHVPANDTWNAASGTWDTSTPNWLGGNPNPNLYSEGDNVLFNETGSNDTITIANVANSGVAPLSTMFNNSTHTYSMVGGSINGIGSVTMNGAGTVALTVANTYTGGTNINAGTIIANGDSALGGTGGALTFGGGTLQFSSTANQTTSRAIIVNAGGGTFNTGNNNYTTSGSASINDVFNKTGSGNLEIDGSVTINAAGALNILSGNVILGQSAGTITQSNGATYNGNLIVMGMPRLNFDTGTYGGTGAIEITNGGTVAANLLTNSVLITNLKATNGGLVNNNIILNSNNLAFTKGDVTQPTYTMGNFDVTIGGTTAPANAITINGVISGSSDVNIANSPGGTGAGELILGGSNTYTGTTEINTSSGVLALGCSNALPTTTDVIVGNESLGTTTGANSEFDLSGYDQTIATLSDGQAVGGTDFLDITNDSTISDSVLTIGSSTQPANGVYDLLTDAFSSNGHTLSIVKAGSDTLTLTNPGNSYSGSTTVSGGVLVEGASGSLPSGGNVINNASFILANGVSETAGNVSGGGTTTVGTGASLTTNNFTQGALANNGTTTIQGSGTVGPISGTGTLALTGGTLKLASGSALSKQGGLTISPGAQLDITNTGIAINYGSAANQAATDSTILSYLSSASMNQAIQSGTSIVSSSLATNTSYAIGEVDGNDNVSGSTVAANTLEVAYTLQGDLNLDGVVNGTDFSILVNHFGQPLAGIGWEQGDINGDGIVNGTDFSALVSNFGASNNSSAFSEDTGGGLVTVPEPAGGMLILAGTGLLARRRRNGTGARS